MGITKLMLSAAISLSGILPASCHKTAPEAAKTPVAPSSINLATNNVLSVMHVLGNLTLTNHCETRVHLSEGKDCFVTPKLLDKRNVQITFAVQTRTKTGQIHDLAVAQVVTVDGQPLEVAVGSYNFTMTPQIAPE